MTEPPLTPDERKVVKEYDNWTHFMQSYELKPWDQDDVDEGKAILEGLAAQAQAEENNKKE